MNEFEDKYKEFRLDENKVALFSHSSVEVAGNTQNKASFIITTVVINHTDSNRPQEIKDAELV